MSPLNSQFIVVTENCLLITLCTRNVSKYSIQWLLNDLRTLTICHGIFDDEVKTYGIESYSKRLIVLSTRDPEKNFQQSIQQELSFAC